MPSLQNIVLVIGCIAGTVNVFSQKPKAKKIEILGANTLEYDESKKDAQRLIGNVRFKHDDALMFCDSAYFYTSRNNIEAYGNVRINQGDSIRLGGDSLLYDGNTKLTRLRGRVTFSDNDMTLTTDYLNYNTKTAIGNYINGGTINSQKNNNVLTSEIGVYDTKAKTLFFKTNVKMVHPEYTITSDTLIYHPDSEISRFYGKTKIVSKENTILCRRGWFDSKREISSFSSGASILSGSQSVSGDSIYYDRGKGVGETFRNVIISDTIEKYTIKGRYALHRERENYSLITGKALLTQRMTTDSLHIAGDTIISQENQTDTDTDSTYKLIRVFHNVKIFKADLQGVCDSLTYNASDSTIRMFTGPVLWTDENQLTADSIDIFLKNEKVSHIFLRENGFIASEQDSTGFNQIKGRRITGFMNDSTLSHLDVVGNGQAAYYVSEDEKPAIGLNRISSSSMKIIMAEGKVNLIKFYAKPEGNIIPMKDITEADKLLKNFVWLIEKRPKSSHDLTDR